MKKILIKIFLILLMIIGIGIIPTKLVRASEEILPTAYNNLNISLRSKSKLVETSSGYMRVFYDGNKICIEYYDDNFSIKSKKSIEMELEIWGGFFAGKDAYYVVEGQNNTDENNNAEVIRVIKYDTDWNKLGSAKITSNSSLFGGEVRYPFDYGCVEMCENNGTLYIVTGHEGYVDDSVGQGHQGFLMITVNESTMTGKIIKSDLWHSFAQYIKCKESYLYVLEQSEGSRYTKLSKYSEENIKGESIPVLEYGGSRTSAWAIACYASVDDMELSSNNALCLGTSIDQSKFDSVSQDMAHNIYLTVTPMNNFSKEATQVKWLTNYEGDGKCFLGTKITKVNDNRFMISWEEYNVSQTASMDDTLSESVLHYVFVDGSGNKISEEFTASAPISDCHPIVKNSKIVFYASNENMVNFYIIDASNGNFSKKVNRVAGENITWKLDNGLLTLSGTGSITVDTKAKHRSPVSSTARSHSYSSSDNAWKPIRKEVEKIVIGRGITSIADNSFNYFGNLTEVEIEDGVKSIGKEAFYSCDALNKITIPSSVISIGEDFLWTGSYWIGSNEHVVRATIYAPSNSYAIKYAKEKDIYFKLTDAPKLDISTMTINNITDQIYTGKEICPTIRIQNGNTNLVNGEDYTVSYSNNTNIGTATVTITGIGDYTGVITKYFNIVEKKILLDISKTKINNIADQIYTGKSIYPIIKIQNGNTSLVNGEDYTVSYSNNTNIGTATVTITGIGNYTRTVTKYFNILPQKVTGVTNKTQDIKSITVKWNKTAGATWYEVYKYDTSKKKYIKVKTTSSNQYKVTNLKAGTTYQFKVRAYKTVSGKNYYSIYSSVVKLSTKTSTPKISKITAGKKKATVKWGKITGATGYEIYMSTNKSKKYSKIKTITNGKTIKYTKSKLKKGKKYYFKIRTYRTVNGKRIYSSYSSVKSVKVK